MTKNGELEFMSEDVDDILRRHTKLNASKVISYLPLNTIENVIMIPLSAYVSTIEKNGGSYMVFRETDCCIASGAVYAFLPEELGIRLNTNKDVLAEAGIPCEPAAFIRAIAATWFENGTNIIPLLKELFGDI